MRRLAAPHGFHESHGKSPRVLFPCKSATPMTLCTWMYNYAVWSSSSPVPQLPFLPRFDQVLCMSPMMKTRATCLSQSAACATLTRAWYSILGELKILGPAIHKNLFSAALFCTGKRLPYPSGRSGPSLNCLKQTKSDKTSSGADYRGLNI